MDDFLGWSIVIGIFVLPFLIEKFSEWKRKVERADEIIKNKNQLVEKEKEINKKIAQNQEILNENKHICNEIQSIVNDNTQNNEYLASLIAEYYSIRDMIKEEMLKVKKNPAIKASDVVAEVKKEKRELLKENKKLEYQLNFLKNNFPMLEDAMQLTKEEIESAFNTIYSDKEYKDDYDTVKDYLTPEEYAKLSVVEKYQKALDRYQTRKKKSLWQIGISYERYIGYIYENKNYKVIYNGALEGKCDLGRDIIAENDEEILIIQCKYWRKESVIRENAIFQLYGTMILQQLQTEKKVKGILVTTTQISDTAKKVAQYLNIQTRENEIFDKTYPCIKCNINRTTREKIYHLPFDQQYDRIKIEINNGEKYVSTVKEADELGFRRARRHINKSE